MRDNVPHKIAGVRPPGEIGVRKIPMLIVEQASLIFTAETPSTSVKMRQMEGGKHGGPEPLLGAFLSQNVWMGVALWTRCAYSAPPKGDPQ